MPAFSFLTHKRKFSPAMSHSSLPRPVEQYHDTNITIEHQKRIKGQTDTITEQYNCKINVVDGQIQLYTRKNGQRTLLLRQESQIRSLTVDILLALIGFLGCKASDYKKKKKPYLVPWTI